MPPAGGEHEIVEVAHELRQPAVAGGQVDRQGPSWGREAEQSPTLGPHPLEHRERAGVAFVGDLPDDRAQRVDGFERHDELVLEEAVAAVEPVPLADHVERMEERRDRLDTVMLLRRLAVPELVERAHGRAGPPCSGCPAARRGSTVGRTRAAAGRPAAGTHAVRRASRGCRATTPIGRGAHPVATRSTQATE